MYQVIDVLLFENLLEFEKSCTEYLTWRGAYQVDNTTVLSRYIFDPGLISFGQKIL